MSSPTAESGPSRIKRSGTAAFLAHIDATTSNLFGKPPRPHNVHQTATAALAGAGAGAGTGTGTGAGTMAGTETGTGMGAGTAAPVAAAGNGTANGNGVMPSAGANAGVGAGVQLPDGYGDDVHKMRAWSNDQVLDNGGFTFASSSLAMGEAKDYWRQQTRGTVKQRTLSQDLTDKDPEWTGHPLPSTPKPPVDLQKLEQGKALGHATRPLPGTPTAYPSPPVSVSWYRRNFRGLVRLSMCLLSYLAVRAFVPAGAGSRFSMYIVSLGDWLQKDENLLTGGALMVFIFTAATGLSLPIIPLELFAGKVYGFPTWASFWLSTLGKQLGSVVSFYIGRKLCKSCIQRKIKEYPIVERLDRAMYDRSLEIKILFLGRWMYGVPAVVKNHFMGALSGTSFDAFFWTALLGDMPHTAFWLYLGAQAESLAAIAEGKTQHGSPSAMVLGLTLFIIATFAWTLHYSKRSFQSTVDQLEAAEARDGERRAEDERSRLVSTVND